jgi:HAD superfamily hydrolase (TIGR01509 family)
MAALRALLVDVGGTLVNDATWLPKDRYDALRLRRLAEAMGGRRPWFDALVGYDFIESDATSYEQRTAEQVTDYLDSQGAVATPQEVEAICRACAMPLHEVVELEEHAEAALRAARALGLRMAICSNTLWRDDADSRRDWEAFGLGDTFDAHVTSHSTGYAKPHPAIFQRCFDALGVYAQEAAIVGDRPERDIAGARAVGMRAIWKRPHDFVGPPDPAPDAEITCLDELAPILERWTRGA